jgi:hypothetical protein
MGEQLVWALRRAREHTLALVADLQPEQMCLQSVPGERHPTWILGHLLLADTYLLSLLSIQELSPDFAELLSNYGPGATPVPHPDRYQDRESLTQRLATTGALRLDGIREWSTDAFDRPMPDPVLAQAQPTLGYHLHSLVFHEGYHGGQLAAWRKAHGLPPVRWVFAPPSGPVE